MTYAFKREILNEEIPKVMRNDQRGHEWRRARVRYIDGVTTKEKSYLIYVCVRCDSESHSVGLLGCDDTIVKKVHGV